MLPQDDNRLNIILDKLDRVTVQTSGGYMARCPAHDDRTPSLSIAQDDVGKIILHCFAGCNNDEICRTIGIKMKDLFPTDSKWEKPSTPSARQLHRRTDKPEKPVRTFPTEAEAIASFHFKTRPIAYRYHEVDSQSRPRHVMTVLRWDFADRKEIRQISRPGQHWQVKGLSSNPLYNLVSIQSVRLDEPIYVVEGEKCADALTTCGILATTSAGGSNAVMKTDWSPLANRNIVLIPDLDEPGDKYAEDVARTLVALNAKVTILDLRDFPDGDQLRNGDDIADWLENHESMTPEDVRQLLIEQTRQSETYNSNPNSPADSNPFPMHVLPDDFQQVLTIAASSIGCDHAFLAMPMLAVVSGIVGATANIQIKEGWIEPLIIWTCTIAKSGFKKSPPLTFVTKPLEAIEDELRLEYQQRYKEWKQQKERFESSRSKGSKAAGSESVPPGPVPIPHRLIVDDCTPEALAERLMENPVGVTPVLQELSSLLQGFDRYSKAEGSERAFYLKCFNAQRVTIDRKTSHPRTIILTHPHLSITGCIQPEIFSVAMTKQHIAAGLAARFLVCQPPYRLQLWREQGIPLDAVQLYSDLLRKLYRFRQARFSREEDLSGEGWMHNIETTTFSFSPDAMILWSEFYNAHQFEAASLDGVLATLWPKLEAYAARLSLAVHLLDYASSDQSAPQLLIPRDTLSKSICLIDWFKQEARRIYSQFSEDDLTKSKRQAAEQKTSKLTAVETLISTKPEGIRTRELQRQLHMSSSELKALIAPLETAGRLEYFEDRVSSGQKTKLIRLKPTNLSTELSQTSTDRLTPTPSTS